MLLLVTGCGRKKIPEVTKGNAVERFQTTALPVPPPVPDVAPVGQEVTSAQTDVEAAQKSVQTVLGAARVSDAPIAAQAVVPLTTADVLLSSAIQKLTTATNRITALESAIVASEQNHANVQKIMQADIERLKTDCKKDNTASNKHIEILAKENQQLKDEDLASARKRLYGIGILLFVVGAGGIVSIFALGFAPGRLIAEIALPMGAICITLASLLTKIVWWTEVGLAIAAIGVIAYGTWHAFWSEPPKKTTKA